MPDVVLVMASLFLALVALVLVATEPGWRRPALCLLAAGLMVGWLGWAYAGFRSVQSAELHDVLDVPSPEGTVTQVIATKDGVINLNQVMRTTVPPGKRVHRMVYSPWRRGVYCVESQVEYTVADGPGEEE